MDYPELIAEVTERSGDSTVATRASMYLRMAEAAINKVLRVAESEAVEDLLTDGAGVATLPSDFSALRLVVVGGREVRAVEFPALILSPPDIRKFGYAVQGDKILTSWADTVVTVHYYAKITPLDLTGTNWLIEDDPEIYLYAMLAQVFRARLEADKAMAAQAVFDGLVAAKRREDAISRFGKKPYRAIGGVV